MGRELRQYPHLLRFVLKVKGMPFSFLSLLPGVYELMAGAEVAILDSEVEAVCWQCLEDQIERVRPDDHRAMKDALGCLDVQKRNKLLSYWSHCCFRFCITHRQTSSELILASCLLFAKLQFPSLQNGDNYIEMLWAVDNVMNIECMAQNTAHRKHLIQFWAVIIPILQTLKLSQVTKPRLEHRSFLKSVLLIIMMQWVALLVKVEKWK